MIKINGVDIITPKVFEVTVTDLDGESNTNANGEIIRDRIAVKRNISIEWQPLSQTEIETILKAVNNVFFTVTFPDPMSGIVTKTMYVQDRTAPAYRFENNEVKWSGLTMNFVEK